MTPLAAALDDYLTLRRSLGYKLQRAGRVLTTFVAHLEQAGQRHVTVESALAWATSSATACPRWQAQQLGIARGFARYLHARDPRHQIPPTGLLPRRQERPSMPWLCSPEDLIRLIAAAGTLRSPLRAATMQTLIGLLAVTGLRVGEAIGLDREDVDLDQGVLLVADFKGKSRRVPLHPSTVTALQAYATRRDGLLPHPASTAFLISTTGTRLHSSNLGLAFAETVRRADLGPAPGQPRPRLGALRHSFAVHTLQDWHRAELDVERSLPLLSAYLGHASPASTYWYLHASPQLLAAAAWRTRHDSAEEVGS
jgi:integrase